MPDTDTDRPNVLWIMADQHSAKCTSWGDFPTDVHTPGLDRLAADGVRFDRAQCQNPICTPSRTSYLTGQYPSNHGIYGLTPDGGRVESPTLFDALNARGYRTGAFGKIHTPKGLIESALNTIRSGEGHNDYLREKGRLDDKDGGQLQEYAEKAGPGAHQALDARPSRLPFEDHFEHWSTERAKDFISSAQDEPFCAWLSFSRPHQVYTPAKEFWDLYPDEADIDLPPSVDEDREAAGKPPHHATPDMDEQVSNAVFEPSTHEGLLRRKLRGYLGCVSEVDALVAEMLDFLDSEGLREDTIVVYCADHGDFAAEHGFPEKAPGISYDAITRVPFVWSWPDRFREGAVVDELVETVDMVPTLLSLIDDADVPAADGHDLTGLLTGDDTDPVREYAVTENAWTKTVRTAEQKLTVYPAGFFGEGSGEYLEFYDLADDPWETTNLAATDDPPREAIDRHLRYLRDFLQTQRRAASALTVDRAPGSLADGTVRPSDVAAHLDEHDGDNYL